LPVKRQDSLPVALQPAAAQQLQLEQQLQQQPQQQQQRQQAQQQQQQAGAVQQVLGAAKYASVEDFISKVEIYRGRHSVVWNVVCKMTRRPLILKGYMKVSRRQTPLIMHCANAHATLQRQQSVNIHPAVRDSRSAG
jgi:hypothetical protein